LYPSPGKQVNVVELQPFSQDSLERLEVTRFVEDLGARVPPIEGVIKPACFIGSRWTWHDVRLAAPLLKENSPDPFVCRMGGLRHFHAIGNQ
jgi:hypothetical protein